MPLISNVESKFCVVSGTLESFQRGKVEDTMVLCSCLAFLIIFVIIFLLDLLQRNTALERETFHVSSWVLNLLSKSAAFFFFLLAFTSIYIKYSLKENTIFVYSEPMYIETVQLCRLMSNYSFKFASK